MLSKQNIYCVPSATKAVKFGFENAKFDHIVVVVVPENTASWKVLERIGFIYEKNAHAYGFDLMYYTPSRDQFQPDDFFYLVHAPKTS